MRTLGLLFLSATLVPATSYAWDSVTQDVPFHAQTHVFNGTEVSQTLFTIPGLGYEVGLSLDVTSTLTLDMKADSDLSWPTALTQQWHGVTRGGSAELTASAILGITITDPNSNFNMTLPATSADFGSGAVKFDTLPLPGGPNSVVVSVPQSAIANISYTFTNALSSFGIDNVDITLGAQIVPEAQVVVSGTKVTTNDVDIDTDNGSGLLQLPTTHNGEYDAKATWQGDASGTFNFAIQAVIGVDTGSATFNFTPDVYTIPFTQDDVKFASDETDFSHALPAISTNSQVDLGTVNVGETNDVDVPVQNVGQDVLEGEATYDGDAAFQVIHSNSFQIDPNASKTVTVHFAPESAGDFTGTLTFATNDPMMPNVEVPVFGTAVNADTGTTDTGVTDTGAGTGDLQTRGCGCNSTPTGAPTGLVGLVLLGLVLRRRRYQGGEDA